MQGKVIVAVALLLAGAGVLTALVPVTPQVLYTPAITNRLTNYTTSTPYTVNYVQVLAEPGQSFLESATYEKIADSLRINVTQSSHSPPETMTVSLFTGPPLSTIIPSWEIEMDWYTKDCALFEQTPDLTPKYVMALPSCTIGFTLYEGFATVDVPLNAIGDPIKVYPVVWLKGSRFSTDIVDVLPKNLEAPELELSRVYVETTAGDHGYQQTVRSVDCCPQTLTRTFETSSTYTWTYSSPYTANVPIGAKMPWAPILLILGAGLLGGIGLIYQRRRSDRNPTEASTGPKGA